MTIGELVYGLEYAVAMGLFFGFLFVAFFYWFGMD